MDYARAIVEFFVERRGKGTAISSADEQLVMAWEDDGIPVSVVFAGIDSAFDRKSEPPKSLSDCGRWVKAGFKKWSAGATLESAGHTVGADTSGDVVTTPAAASDETTADERLVAELERRVQVGHVALRAATAAVLSEVRALAAGAGVPPHLLAVVDEAIAESALDQLPAEERASVVAAAEEQLRGRTMSGAAWAAARAREIIRTLSE